MIKDKLIALGLLPTEGRFLRMPDHTHAVYSDDKVVDAADRVPLSAGGKLPGVVTHDVTIELYEPKPDDKTEAAIEAELDAQGLSWEKQDRYWLQDVQRYQVIYEYSYTTKS
jgi:hypothetical protein